MKGTSDKMPKAPTAQVRAEQHGVDEKTLRRDGKFAEAVEALDMEDEIVSGEVSAPKAVIVEAGRRNCKRLQPKPFWEK